MKNILVIDDNNTIRSGLVALIHECDTQIKTFEASTEEQGYKLAMDKKIDLFFVDIVLDTKEHNDTSGLSFARNIRKIAGYEFTPMVFVTSISNLELYTYKELHCYDYIIKPIDKGKVRGIINKLKTSTSGKQEEEWIDLRIESIIYPIPVRDVVYIESKDRVLEVHTRKETLRVPYLTINKCLSNIKTKNLLKCHRSIVVNKEYIRNIDTVNRYIELKDGYGTLEIGANIKKKFLEEFYAC